MWQYSVQGWWPPQPPALFKVKQIIALILKFLMVKRLLVPDFSIKSCFILHTSIKIAANAMDINPLVRITRKSLRIGLFSKNLPNFAHVKFELYTTLVGGFNWRVRSGATLLEEIPPDFPGFPGSVGWLLPEKR